MLIYHFINQLQKFRNISIDLTTGSSRISCGVTNLPVATNTVLSVLDRRKLCTLEYHTFYDSSSIDHPVVYLGVGEGHAGLQGDLVIIVGKAIFRVVCSINPLPEISGELDQFVDLLRVTLRSSGSGVYVASSNVNLQFDLKSENDCLDVFM